MKSKIVPVLMVLVVLAGFAAMLGFHQWMKPSRSGQLVDLFTQQCMARLADRKSGKDSFSAPAGKVQRVSDAETGIQAVQGPQSCSAGDTDQRPFDAKESAAAEEKFAALVKDKFPQLTVATPGTVKDGTFSRAWMAKKADEAGNWGIVFMHPEGGEAKRSTGTQAVLVFPPMAQ